MRHNILLAALAAALTFLPTTGAKAQAWEDITSGKLTNPSFESTIMTSIRGWTLTTDARDETFKVRPDNDNTKILNYRYGTKVKPTDGVQLVYLYSTYSGDEQALCHTMTQTVSNLAAGTYRVRADISVHSNAATCYGEMYATVGSQTTTAHVEHVTSNQSFTNYEAQFTLDQWGSVVLGFRFTLDGCADNKSIMLIDNVRLERQRTTEQIPDINARLRADIFGNDYSTTTPYNVIMWAISNDRHNVHLRAVTCQPGNPTEGGYEHMYTDLPGETYRGQAFYFESVDETTEVGRFIMSYTNHEGGTNYICTAKTGYDASQPAENLRATTDRSKALKIRIERSGDYLTFHNTEADDKIIGGRDQGFYTADTYRNLRIRPAATLSVPVEIAAGAYATRIFPFTPTVIEGVEYYSCEGVGDDRVLTLTPVAQPQAHTPYILHATDGAVSTTLTGLATARDDSYAADLLTGLYTAATVPTGSYVLQTTDHQAFYPVTTALTATPYRAYLTLPATDNNVAPLRFPTDLATDIDALPAAALNGPAYDLAGRRVSHPRHGLYLIGGRKVLIK